VSASCISYSNPHSAAELQDPLLGLLPLDPKDPREADSLPIVHPTSGQKGLALGLPDDFLLSAVHDMVVVMMVMV
jgi:hypothetical protein